MRRKLFRSLLPVLALAGACAPDDTDPDDIDTAGDTDVVATGASLLVHRLDAASWRRSVRDVLDLEASPDVDLPLDATLGVFDHMVEGLTMTPYLLERLDAATVSVLQPLADDAAHPTWTDLADCDLSEAGCRHAAVHEAASRAWRRPITDEERTRLAGVVDAVVGEPPALAAAAGLRAVLLSPHFLFRVEPRAFEEGTLVDAWVLAARMAAFLWNSVPDEGLRTAARDGTLLDPEVRAAQARRMLADPRADSLVDGLSGQWLGTRSVVDTAPVRNLDWTDTLKADLQAEMQWRFQDVLTRDAPIGELFTETRALLTPEIAGLYNTRVTKPEVTDIPLRRAGWLTTAGWLSITSKATRISPSVRGKWILERLLCEELGAPPDGVEGIPEDIPLDGKTPRQVMEEVTANAACQRCHARFDPYGFAFGHYGPDGAYVMADASFPIDDAVTLPDGTAVDGPLELQEALAVDPRLGRCATEQIATYSLGRVPEDDVVDAIHEPVAAAGTPLATTIEAVVASDWFATRAPEVTE